MAANSTNDDAVDAPNPAIDASLHDSTTGIDAGQVKQASAIGSEALVAGEAVQQESILSETSANAVDNRQEQDSVKAQDLAKDPLLENSAAETAESVTPEPPSSKKKLEERNVVSESDKEAAAMEEETPPATELAADKHAASTGGSNEPTVNHSPTSLPRFREPRTCMWTATYAANAPCEDKSSSLVNVLLRPFHEKESHSLVRLSLWSVLDGHGGGCVATYASEVLLPHLAANIASCLECEIVDGGECRVNGLLRDANAIDFEGLLDSPTGGASNPNSIHYRTVPEDEYYSEEEEEESMSVSMDGETEEECDQSVGSHSPSYSPCYSPPSPVYSDSSVESNRETGPVGTHSADEVARVMDAVTDSFCSVDEGWINSIDSVASRQTSCQTNGAWNAGACALVVFTVQRLEWTMTSDAANVCNNEAMRSSDDADEQDASENRDTVHVRNEDARVRLTGSCGCHYYQPQAAMLYTGHVGDCRAVLFGDAPRKTMADRSIEENGMESVDESGAAEDETCSDDSSFHSDEATELLSCSSTDSVDSSDDEDDGGFLDNSEQPARMRYMARPARRLHVARDSSRHEPFVPLPPLNNNNKNETSTSSDESEDEPARKVPRKETTVKGSNKTKKHLLPVLSLSPFTCSIDLTTDHTPYVEEEVDLVLRRCNDAPKAISSSIGGGIPRVAGSLAVTRALGDAYLKTPLLSFFPYKRYSPYITAYPEVSYRLLPVDPTNATKVVVLASDGVWDNVEGGDILRWIRNFSEEQTAAAEREESKKGITERPLSPESFPDENTNTTVPKKRKLRPRPSRAVTKRGTPSRSNPATLVIRRVLNKVRRSKRMSMQDLLALPKGRSRRVKHDDMTAIVVDVSAFVH